MSSIASKLLLVPSLLLLGWGVSIWLEDGAPWTLARVGDNAPDEPVDIRVLIGQAAADDHDGEQAQAIGGADHGLIELVSDTAPSDSPHVRAAWLTGDIEP